jgi:hypothetical protein
MRSVLPTAFPLVMAALEVAPAVGGGSLFPGPPDPRPGHPCDTGPGGGLGPKTPDGELSLHAESANAPTVLIRVQGDK